MSEAYLAGGDTLASVDHPTRQGQTFRVLESHTLQYMDFQMKGAMIYNKPVIQVFNAGIFNAPYGPVLSRNRHIIEQQCSIFSTGRVRFSMQPVLLNVGEYYVVTIRNYPSLLGNVADWQYDQGDATYPRGYRISSPDAGETWHTHAGDDFMFAEFGDPPVLTSEKAPPIDNFATIDLSYFHNPNSITFTLATSVPCHLFCYYTDKKPLKHPSTREVRGLIMPWGTYFCFVAYKLVEQTEVGDTLYHTFEMPAWVYCQTKWFTFRGTIDAALSPSVGPIFQHHHDGTDSFCNLGFEDYPISPRVPPCWTPSSYKTGIAVYSRDEVNVREGQYSCKLQARGQDFIARLTQQKWLTAFHNKTALFTFHWFGGGRGSISVGGKSVHFNLSGGWHAWSANITFPDRDYLLTMRISAGGRGSSFTALSYDDITIEQV